MEEQATGEFLLLYRWGDRFLNRLL